MTRIEEPCYADPSLFLMVDPKLVETTENVILQICPMEKNAEPVLRPTETWEGGDGKKGRPVHSDPVDGTVLFDVAEKKFHLWYRTHNHQIAPMSAPSHSHVPPRGSIVCLATSADGLNWHKPRLDLVNVDQSSANNMIPACPPPIKAQHLSGITVNRVPGLPGKLVATVYSHFDDPVYPQGITFLTSDDGLTWTPHFPPVLPMDGDAHCLMWDWNQGCYLCTTRSYAYGHIIGRLAKAGIQGLRNKRHVALARSRDLIHWTPMLPVLEADAKDPSNAQLYYMYILPYGHGYLGFVQLFYMQEPEMTYGPLDMQLAFSRDLVTWTRVEDRAAILPRGPAGAWDQSHVSLTTNPPHPEGDRLRFWYGGKDTEHWQNGNAALGTATLKRDAFAGYTAGAGGGTVTTAPFDMTWAAKLNVSADAARGEIRLEILDADSLKPLEGTAAADCQPLTADEPLQQVSFGERRGTFVRHTGRIRFRFHLKNATLYAFRATNCAPAP